MNELPLTVLFASVLATAAPLIIATLGETITEKAGVINLSLDGSLGCGFHAEHFPPFLI